MITSLTHIPTSMFETYFTPLIAKSSIVSLYPFNRVELDFMVELLIGKNIFTSQDLQRLYELSGGWPYFAKAILVSLQDVSPGKNLVDQALPYAVANPSLGFTLENIYQVHFDDNEKAAVLLLAMHSGYIGSEHLSRVKVSVKEGLIKLVRRNFVAGTATSGYTFQVGLLTHWFHNWHQFNNQISQFGYLIT